MNKKLLVAIISILTILGVVYYEQTTTPKTNPSIVTNNDTNGFEITAKNPIELPNFPINIIGKKDIKNIYDIKANKIIIHFWASWCTVCAKEFNDIINQAKLNPNTAIVAVSIDEDRDSLGEYLDTLEKKHKIKNVKNLMFSWDHDKALSQNIFGSELVPENYIAIKKDDKYHVVEKTIGRVAWNKILANTIV